MQRLSQWFRAPIAAAFLVSLSVSAAAPAFAGPSADAVPTASEGPAGDQRAAAPADSEGSCTPSVSAKLVPSCGAWFGVGPNPYGSESFDDALVQFESTIQRTVDISHYYTRGATLFPTSGMLNRANEPGRERLLLVNWKPDMSWARVAAGDYDSYLIQLAQHIRSVYPDPFFLSLGAEPEDEVNQTPGSGMTATDYRNFFRHTVGVLRANGAKSVVFVMNYMGAPHWPGYSWFDDLYPGNDVVDWLAEDQYAFGDELGEWLSDFGGMVDRHDPGTDWPGFYTWATTNYPGKPIMLGEWGVSEEPEFPWYKPQFFNDTPKQRREDYPWIKALVYWSSDGDTMMGDTRPESSPASLAAYRGMAARNQFTRPGEFYLGRPAER